MFLKKANFFENLILISLEPEAKPMKDQALQAKPQFCAELFYQIRTTNEHDFDITNHAGFTSSIFRFEPVSKMPMSPFKMPAATFWADIETQITKNTKTQEIRRHSKFRHIDFQHKKPNFDQSRSAP